MPRRPPVALGVLVLSLTACAGPAATRSTDLAVTPVNGLPVRSLVQCRTLMSALPEELGAGNHRRATTPASDTTTAWGEPAITLRCGVGKGSPLDDPYTFNAVRWALHDTGGSRTWTTLDRTVNVAVQIPDAYSGQAELVGTVSFAVAKSLR